MSFLVRRRGLLPRELVYLYFFMQNKSDDTGNNLVRNLIFTLIVVLVETIVSFRVQFNKYNLNLLMKRVLNYPWDCARLKMYYPIE